MRAMVAGSGWYVVRGDAILGLWPMRGIVEEGDSAVEFGRIGREISELAATPSGCLRKASDLVLAGVSLAMARPTMREASWGVRRTIHGSILISSLPDTLSEGWAEIDYLPDPRRSSLIREICDRSGSLGPVAQVLLDCMARLRRYEDWS